MLIEHMRICGPSTVAQARFKGSPRLPVTTSSRTSAPKSDKASIWRRWPYVLAQGSSRTKASSNYVSPAHQYPILIFIKSATASRRGALV